MPAFKPDMTTVNGRLAYARDRGGFEVEAFAKLMGYEKKGWQNIEQGQRELKTKQLQEANEYLKLDFNYYFGLIDYDEAKSQKKYDLSLIAQKIDMVMENTPVYGLDPDIQKLSMRLQANADLRRHTERLAYQPSDVVVEIDNYAAFVLSQRGEKERGSNAG